MFTVPFWKSEYYLKFSNTYTESTYIFYLQNSFPRLDKWYKLFDKFYAQFRSEATKPVAWESRNWLKFGFRWLALNWLHPSFLVRVCTNTVYMCIIDGATTGIWSNPASKRNSNQTILPRGRQPWHPRIFHGSICRLLLSPHQYYTSCPMNYLGCIIFTNTNCVISINLQTSGLEGNTASGTHFKATDSCIFFYFITRMYFLSHALPSLIYLPTNNERIVQLIAILQQFFYRLSLNKNLIWSWIDCSEAS